jgi:hypothetical protein
MLTLVGRQCCFDFTNPIGGVAGFQEQRLAFPIWPIRAGYTWRRKQNPISETSCLKKYRMIYNAQNCDSYINISSSQTYR